MRPTFVIPAGFQLAAIVVLALLPIISATPSPAPPDVGGQNATIVEKFGGWHYTGCFPDSNEARTLSTPITGGLNMVEYCLDACEGFAFAGMEFGAECWCGNAIQHGNTLIDPVYCNVACPGNSAQICGGVHSLVVYIFTGSASPDK